MLLLALLSVLLSSVWCASPACPTSQVANWMIDKKVVFYSPAAIGVDPHRNKVDLYTSYFDNLHQLNIPIIKYLNATHVLVSDNWSADGGKEHTDFMDLIAHNDLKLIVTFPLPLRSPDMTDDDFKEAIDEAKKAFIRLVKEFTGWVDNSTKVPYLEGFWFRAPPIAKMSAQDVLGYFSTITTFHNQMLEIQTDSTSKSKFFVGWPLDPQTGKGSKGPDYMSVPADVWTIDFYTDVQAFYSAAFKDLWAAINASSHVLPMITADSFSGDDQQDNKIQSIYKVAQTNLNSKPARVWGTAITEFNDEWWRSYLGTAGYSVEGCPNSNAYAHSMCGIPTWGDKVLSLEYTGLFSISDAPFMYCYTPKIAIVWLNCTWHSTNQTAVPVWNSTTKQNPICAPMNLIVPENVVYILVIPPFLCLVVLALLLIVPPPQPPTRNDLEMSLFIENSFVA